MELNRKTRPNSKGWCKIENELVDVYAKYIGIKATAVYVCLRRHYNATTEIAFPSYKTIAIKLDVSTKTVLRNIKILKNHNIITVHKERTYGKWPKNIYCFTNPDQWLRQSRGSIKQNHVTDKSPPDDSEGISSVTDSHTNKTKVKKTNNKETKTDESVGPVSQGIDNIRKDINNLIDKIRIKHYDENNK